MTISSTFFPHKDIHKYTWKSPDGSTLNQIHHVVIDKRFKSSFSDVRSYQGADCDSDHFSVIANFRIKLKKVQKTNNIIPKYNLEKLKEEGENKKYIESLTEKLRPYQTDNLETSDRWIIIRNTITEAPKKNTR